jgi:hypothetical protein
MSYMLLKLPIYFIIWHKVIQISKVRRELAKTDALNTEDEFMLTIYMIMYGCVFFLLLFS